MVESVRSKAQIPVQELRAVIVIINNCLVCLGRLCGKKNLIVLLKCSRANTKKHCTQCS